MHSSRLPAPADLRFQPVVCGAPADGQAVQVVAQAVGLDGVGVGELLEGGRGGGESQQGRYIGGGGCKKYASERISELLEKGSGGYTTTCTVRVQCWGRGSRAMVGPCERGMRSAWVARTELPRCGLLVVPAHLSLGRLLQPAQLLGPLCWVAVLPRPFSSPPPSLSLLVGSPAHDSHHARPVCPQIQRPAASVHGSVPPSYSWKRPEAHSPLSTHSHLTWANPQPLPNSAEM